MANNWSPIVIGASAGGVEALLDLVSALPGDLDAPVFVCLHISAGARGALPQILTRLNRLPASYPANGQRIQPGKIYISPPDHHMMIRGEFIELTRGPKENGARPAIDPLFRSAAIHYSSRVIGVILSGALDDGSYGLQSIQASGGKVLVQDPTTALFSDMPEAALRLVTADYIGSPNDLGTILSELVQTAIRESNGHTRRTDVIETKIAELRGNPESTKEIGIPSQFGCPHCAGVLFEVKEDADPRYRCRVGHSFTAKTLLDAQSTLIENALWSAVRALQERADLLKRIARRMPGSASALRFSESAQEALGQAQAILELLSTEAAAQPQSKELEPELHLGHNEKKKEAG
jgi:two-component system chemotaxis response regulator CheB